MNCAQAKAIPIQELLAALGFTPARTTRKGTWYHSPFCGEGGDRNPSFQVTPDGKGFHDWSSDAKGNIIDLAELMIGIRSTRAALQFIERVMGGNPSVITPTISNINHTEPAVFEDVVIEPLHSGPLCSYLYRRGISWDLAKQYCVEIHYFRQGYSTEYYAVGFENRSGGYELRNPYFKGAMAPKDITVIGNVPNSTCLVFEGFTDFLSAIELGWFDARRMSAVVLNSTSLVDRSMDDLKTASKVVCLMDGDDSGRKATGIICRTLPFAMDHSSFFTQRGYKDVNDLRKAILRMNNFFNKERPKEH